MTKCQGRKIYFTKGAAKHAANRLRMKSFKCKDCRDWHVARQRPSNAIVETPTASMLMILETAKILSANHGAGVFAQGAGQASSIRGLVKRGLLKSAGWGFDLDGVRENEVEVFVLTKQGSTFVKQLDPIPPI